MIQLFLSWLACEGHATRLITSNQRIIQAPPWKISQEFASILKNTQAVFFHVGRYVYRIIRVLCMLRGGNTRNVFFMWKSAWDRRVHQHRSKPQVPGCTM